MVTQFYAKAITFWEREKECKMGRIPSLLVTLENGITLNVEFLVFVNTEDEMSSIIIGNHAMVDYKAVLFNTPDTSTLRFPSVATLKEPSKSGTYMFLCNAS